MTRKLWDFLNALKDCAEKLEEELKININDCHNMVSSGVASEIKLALDVAKDTHYAEIMKFMSQITVNIKQIIYHEEQIKNLSSKQKLTDEELKKYSYVQRQVNRFDNTVTFRKKKEERTVSNRSISSLDDWEKLLDLKEKEQFSITSSLPCLNVPPPLRNREVRKLRTILSSTNNNFLDENEIADSTEFTADKQKNYRDRFSDSSYERTLSEILENDDEDNLKNPLNTNENEEPIGNVIEQNKIETEYNGHLEQSANSNSNEDYINKSAITYKICETENENTKDDKSFSMKYKYEDINENKYKLCTISDRQDNIKCEENYNEEEQIRSISYSTAKEEEQEGKHRKLSNISISNKNRDESVLVNKLSEANCNEQGSSKRISYNKDEDEKDAEEANNTGNEASQYPLYNLLKSLSDQHLLDSGDTKPRIVDVVYKKQYSL